MDHSTEQPYRFRRPSLLPYLTILLIAFPGLITNWLSGVTTSTSPFVSANLWRLCLKRPEVPIGTLEAQPPRLQCCSLFHDTAPPPCDLLWHYLDKHSYRAVGISYLLGFTLLLVTILLKICIKKTSGYSSTTLCGYIYPLLLTVVTFTFSLSLLLFNSTVLQSNGMIKVPSAQLALGYYLAFGTMLVPTFTSFYYVLVILAKLTGQVASEAYARWTRYHGRRFSADTTASAAVTSSSQFHLIELLQDEDHQVMILGHHQPQLELVLFDLDSVDERFEFANQSNV